MDANWVHKDIRECSNSYCIMIQSTLWYAHDTMSRHGLTMRVVQKKRKLQDEVQIKKKDTVSIKIEAGLK